VSDGLFTLIAAPRTRGPARLGLAVSKRCAASAVARNRLKRVIRESFRQHHVQLPAGDYVVMCRPAAAAQPNAVLFASMAGLWKRAGRKLERQRD